jgi:hypothetical protein
VTDERLVPFPWADNAVIAIGELGKALKDFAARSHPDDDFDPTEFEIVLPVGMYPDLKEIEGVKVNHHVACPEGQTLILCMGYLQRQHEGLMKSLFSWPDGHWRMEEHLRDIASG